MTSSFTRRGEGDQTDDALFPQSGRKRHPAERENVRQHRAFADKIGEEGAGAVGEDARENRFRVRRFSLPPKERERGGKRIGRGQERFAERSSRFTGFFSVPRCRFCEEKGAEQIVLREDLRVEQREQCLRAASAADDAGDDLAAFGRDAVFHLTSSRISPAFFSESLVMAGPVSSYSSVPQRMTARMVGP